MKSKTSESWRARPHDGIAYEHRRPDYWGPCYKRGFSIPEICEMFDTNPDQVKCRLLFDRVPLRTTKTVIAGYSTVKPSDWVPPQPTEEEKRMLRRIIPAGQIDTVSLLPKRGKK